MTNPSCTCFDREPNAPVRHVAGCAAGQGETCEHTYEYGGLVYYHDDYPMAGTGAKTRRYSDWFFCTRCLANQYTNERPIGNSADTGPPNPPESPPSRGGVRSTTEETPMGYMRHHAIIVTSWDEKLLTEAHGKARAIFEPQQVTAIVRGVVNAIESRLLAGRRAQQEPRNGDDR
jgi:hypothetical protein